MTGDDWASELHGLLAGHLGEHVLGLLGLDELVLLLLLDVLEVLLLAVTVDEAAEDLGVVVVDVLVDAGLEAFEELVLDLLLDVGGDEGLGLPDPVPALGLLLDGDNLLLALQLQLAGLDDHLPQLGQPLLALVDHEGRPVEQVLVDLLQGLLVGLVEPHLLPEVVGQVGPFGGLHVEVGDALLLPHGGVLGVAEGAGLPVAESGQVVLVPAEVLAVGPALQEGYFMRKAQCLFLMTFQTTSSIIILQQLQLTPFPSSLNCPGSLPSPSRPRKRPPLWFEPIIGIMLSMSKASQLDIVGPLPVCLKHPAFGGKGSLWLKNDTHPTIKKADITEPRYRFIKIGKTFGFEAERFVVIHEDHLFYYDDEKDKDYKGYCNMENVYVQWFRLKSGRHLLFLTNSEDSCFFYFENTVFWDENRTQLAKHMVQLNYGERYEELESIGKGSFSVVMKARDRKTGKEYAAKVINKKDKNKSSTKNLVLEERRILRTIRSKYVYRYEELFEEENCFIVIMEYLHGKDLMTLWKEKKLNDPAMVMNILRGLLEGIRDIHSFSIIHRDLKPQNIHIDPTTSKPFIIDFGLSLILDERVTTKSYKRCGTMGYMAPEVIENSGEYKKPYNARCDLFSFGIIAHMLLLGNNPVKGDSYDETYMKNKACEINLNKAALAAKWGQHAFSFLNKLLAKYPQFRLDGEQAIKHEFMKWKGPVPHDKEESSSTLEDKNKGNALVKAKS